MPIILNTTFDVVQLVRRTYSLIDDPVTQTLIQTKTNPYKALKDIGLNMDTKEGTKIYRRVLRLMDSGLLLEESIQAAIGCDE